MKIIAFAGSPRIGGNSDLLLDEWIKGAQAAGATVEKVYADKVSVGPCKHCDACRQLDSEGCMIDDDMQGIYSQLVQADLWVLATPVYWWGPSAQLKLIVDRWYGMMKNHRQSIKGKEAALILAMGDDDMKTAQPTIDMFSDAFEYLNIKLHEPIVVTAHERGEVKGNPTALKLAFDHGSKAVRNQLLGKV